MALCSDQNYPGFLGIYPVQIEAKFCGRRPQKLCENGAGAESCRLAAETGLFSVLCVLAVGCCASAQLPQLTPSIPSWEMLGPESPFRKTPRARTGMVEVLLLSGTKNQAHSPSSPSASCTERELQLAIHLRGYDNHSTSSRMQTMQRRAETCRDRKCAPLRSASPLITGEKVSTDVTESGRGLGALRTHHDLRSTSPPTVARVKRVQERTSRLTRNESTV